ncbi:MAG TPA: hypothetical protein VIM71_06405 [Lacunisphaera sp.]
MKSLDVPIIGDSKDAPQDDPEYTLNLYGEQVSDEVYTLKPTPGSELYGQFAVGGGGRGLVTVGGRLFGVRGAYFQEMIDGEPLVRGSLLTNSAAKVAMVYHLPPNGNGQILIVDETNGYVFELATNTFTVLAPPASPEDDGFVGGGCQATYCAGRALVFIPGNRVIRCSEVNDFLIWPGLGTATAESLATPLKAIASNGNLFYAFSDDGFEVWQFQDADQFPFAPILSGDKIGILAPQSLLFIERFAYWLGRTDTGEGVVYRHSGGGQPERISTHAYERRIADLSTPSDAIGCTYNSLGHTFYLLNFRAGNKTFCWDKATSLWHDRAVREPVSGNLSGLPWVATVVFEGEILAIGYQSGQVLHIDDELFTDTGNPILRERILTVIPKEGDWLTYYQSAELFGTVGNTPVGQQVPNIMMKYSTDRGMTWSLERWQSTGGNHSYGTRTRWVGLGAAFGLALWFRVVSSHFISWRMVRVYAE